MCMKGIWGRLPWIRVAQSGSAPAEEGLAALPGVNLGGWLVLEKWMTPGLFPADIQDEYSLCESGDWSTLDQIRQHHETFITKEDFVWLADAGIKAVRLPIGYWVFGDAPPYKPTARYVDRAFKWAAETGVKILLDLHAAPGSQNGNDHSGRIGPIGWDKAEANRIQSLEVILKLARRYGKHPALLGFELLNEPSAALSKRVLRQYYEIAYKIIRVECGDNPWVVFSDGFKPKRWRKVLHGPQYQHVFIDTHQYQTFSEADRRLTPLEHIRKTLGPVFKELEGMRKYHQVIVGEWNLTMDRQSLAGLSSSTLSTARQQYATAQMLIYGQMAAWFFWNYKTEGGGTQSFRDCVMQGWLPLRSYRSIPTSSSLADAKTEIQESQSQHEVQQVVGGIDIKQSQDLSAAAGKEAQDSDQAIQYAHDFKQYAGPGGLA